MQYMSDNRQPLQQRRKLVYEEHVPQIKTHVTMRGFILCLIASLFYLYEFFLRVTPSVITAQLMQELDISALGVGTMSAFYFYAYAPMQLPAGLLMDRFGPRVLLTFMCFLCTLGAFLFGSAHDVAIASFSRFLIGFGSSFAFVGVLLLISRWFPPKYFAVMAGVTQFLGSAGAVAAQKPLAAAVNVVGWRVAHYGATIFGVLLMLAMWFSIRDYPQGVRTALEMREHKKEKGFKLELFRLKTVLAKSQTWWAACYAFGIWAPISIFASLWGVVTLVTLYHVDTIFASGLVSLIWVSNAITSPMVGWWTDHIRNRRIPMIVSALVGLIASCVLLYVPHLNLYILGLVLLAYGFAASAQVISFGVVRDINSPDVYGTAIGFNNMAVVTGGALFQPLVGYLLQKQWTGEFLHSIPVYTAHAYKIALLIIPSCFLIALLASIFGVRETHCQIIHPQSE